MASPNNLDKDEGNLVFSYENYFGLEDIKSIDIGAPDKFHEDALFLNPNPYSRSKLFFIQ